MKANPTCWFEVYVQDMPRAKAFSGTSGRRHGSKSRLPLMNEDHS